MRSRLLLLTMLAFITALLAFRVQNNVTSIVSVEKIQSFKKKNIVRCGPDWEELKEWLEETSIPIIPGAGNYQWKISTANDSAQFYFNQGINMYYSFHIIEAMASFKKAAKFDPGSAMVHWAQALAYGPNINDVGYAASPDALIALDLAAAAIDKASAKEKILIRAQQVRYSVDSAKLREDLNQLYVDQMKAAYEQYPADADVAALYADALMLQHPWDLWKNDGTPKPWTPLIRTVLEKLLAKKPNHPGANHYYIHVMEPSPFAAKAIPSADRLGKLTPGLSHTVHMPSHIYLRTGQYGKGSLVNEAAVKSYKKIIPLYAPVTGNDFLYLIHNLHMKTNTAMLAGRSSYSSLSARETANSIPNDYLSIPGGLGNYVQYIHMSPVLVDVRFGNWGQLLLHPQPNFSQVYSTILYRFGRGMALVQQARLAEARYELEQLQQLEKDSSLAIPMSPFSPAINGAMIADHILSGTIALKEKRYDDAVAAFKKAVTIEENMVYDEPRDWLLNPKHYLGNALIKAGRFKEAITTLQQDLLTNQENGWALFGIWQALTAEKKTAEAAKLLTRFKKAFDKSDIKLYGPTF
ncbi:MAG: tetratricopeptide repeat protein [Bacteroidota bacterium]|nr:tetratricopeptide repeat protein [Bacteroidota bacterium]